MKANSVSEGLNIVWTVASKDIIDGVKNKTVVTMILVLIFMLMVPKALPLVFVASRIQLPVYAPEASELLEDLRESNSFDVRAVDSLQAFESLIVAGYRPQLGLVLPADVDQRRDAGGELSLDGYVSWANRARAVRLKADLETALREALDRPVRIRIEGNLAYPSEDLGSMMGMLALSSVVIVFAMGLGLVPMSLFEEKQTKTMEALLVSPASAGQVVIGKALAGLVYLLVTAAMVFVINWAWVVHWGLALLWAVVAGFFSLSLGLVLGSFFERQQEIGGPAGLILVLLVGAGLVDLMNLQVPDVISKIVPWVPSVSLIQAMDQSFAREVVWGRVIPQLGGVLALSAVLLALVTWKVRRLDR